MGEVSPIFVGIGFPFSPSAFSSFSLLYGVFLYTACEYTLNKLSEGILIMLREP